MFTNSTPAYRGPKRTEPPQGLHPSHTGVLLHGHVRSEDVAAQVMQFAVDGAMRITPTIAEVGWFRTTTKTWRLDRRPGHESAAYSGARRKLLDALFDGRSTTTLAEAKGRTRRAANELIATLTDEAADLGLTRRSSFQKIIRPAIFATAAGLFLLTWAAPRNIGPFLAIFPVFFTLIVVFAISTFFFSGARRTPAGDTAAAELRAFSAYLRSGDGALLAGPRGAEVFGRYLPWAVATGTAREWSTTFTRAVRELSASDRAAAAAWVAQLAWFGGTWANHSPDVSFSSDDGDDSGAVAFPDPGPVDGLADGGSFGDLGDLGDLGDSLSGFADSMSDFADSIGDFADSAGSDIGSGGDSGGGDGGGGDSGGGGGD